MNFRLTRPVSLYDDVDNENADPDREPTVHLPAGAVLTDVEVDPADESVGLTGSVIGDYGGRLVGWFGSNPEARDIFVDVAPADAIPYASDQIRVTLAAAPHVASTLTELTQPDPTPWVVAVEVSTRYSTPHVEIVAVCNAEEVENGADPDGYYLWWAADSKGNHGCWTVERMSDRKTIAVYDDDWGDHPVPGRAVVIEAFRGLPLEGMYKAETR